MVWMLDTNTVSYFLRRHPQVMAKISNIPPSSIVISSITEAELLFGVAKRQNKTLKAAVMGFLDTVSVYPWDSAAAETYGKLRASLEKKGQVMGTLDMLIAAHALSEKTTIVTSDRAFHSVAGLRAEDWTV
ncbi:MULTISPECIES: type II toxin-antitoxin system VapC family toxin [Buttiauxella]|uniref:type II toxin-antitoxin system VapC family toxin n=1 Tax=Buttiauxella TaxID=82976 RepID=UPI00156143C8|nr:MULTISPECIES: type II toxin-antitoxin system VapC family toxin [Buttiauxella]MCS3604211.1 tRNA(fMet)-specific endonuclease VapC [Buttiauxella sp. BIGb0471]BCG10398.1 PIN domain-containing protein [Buttiauxella agrestis]